eukprot:13194787-Ditylum_brightwellii.AAC.1
METLKSGVAPALVTNIEVLDIVSRKLNHRAEENSDEPDNNRRQRRGMQSQLRHRDWIEERMYEYLKSTPCANVDIAQMPSLVSDLRGKRKAKNSASSVHRKVTNGDEGGDDHAVGEGVGNGKANTAAE